jgi:hypothetical protein
MSRSNFKVGNSVSAQLLGWLGKENMSASVLMTAQRLLSLQESLAQQLPPALQKNFVVLKWGEGELKLGTLGSAQAAKLRQFAPRMQHLMTELGHKIDAVTIKVLAEPPVPAAARLVKEARPIDRRDLDHFVLLADSLEPGPLADAVAKLIDRRKGL